MTPRALPLLLALLLPSAAIAAPLTVETSKVDVTFHISHPAKEYDANLLPDGAAATLNIDPKAIEKTTATFAIKVDHFDSANTRRDSHMLEVMEAFVYPTIDWDVTKVSGASGAWSVGSHTFTAEGPLTVHGVTKPLKVPVAVTVAADGALSFSADFSIALEDHGIERPTLVFVPIENHVPIKVTVASKANPDLIAAATAKAEEPAPAAAEDAEAPAGFTKDGAGDEEAAKAE